MKRRLADEVAHGYPGFPYHHVTTEDLTTKQATIYLRPRECGGCFDGYLKPLPYVVPVERFHQPRTRFGALWRRRMIR